VELARSVAALTSLAENMVASLRLPRTRNACWPAHRLGAVLKKHAPLAQAAQQHTGFRAATEELLAIVAHEDVTFSDVRFITQAAGAQVHFGHACPAFWQRLMTDQRCASQPAWARSNLLWVRARLAGDGLIVPPDEAEWHQLCAFLGRGEDAKSFANGMNGQDLSTTLWAGAKVGAGFPPDILAALLAAINHVASRMNAQDVANTVWALGSMQAAGKLGAEVLSEARAALLHRMHDEASRMIPQEVANCVHGLAHLGWDVPDRVRGAVLQRLQQTAGGMSSQQIANSVYALGRLGWRDLAPVLAALFAAPDRVWDGMIPQAVSNTLHGLASMPAVVDREVDVPPRTRTKLCSALVREAPNMNGQTCANSVWALGQLRWHFNDDVKAALEAWLTERALELTPQNVSNTLLGLAAAAAPLSVVAMAALLTAADAKLLCGRGTEEPVQQATVNALYAIAVLAHLGVAVEEGLVLRLAQVALRYQLDVEACFQVRPDPFVERLGMPMCMIAEWGRERQPLHRDACSSFRPAFT
jgi:hypothetical protein